MKKFSDFADEDRVLEGDRARIDEILNKKVIVTGYRVRKSRYSKNQSGEYLTLQIKVEDDLSVVFTGSDVLIQQLKKYGHEIPFEVVIKKINRYYTLT